MQPIEWEGGSTGIVLRKNTRFPLVTKERYFEVDEDRSAMTYYVNSKKQEFCGAVPLELIARVGRDERGNVEIDIPGRSFVLSADASIADDLDKWVEELALLASARQGADKPQGERAGEWWKDEAAYRTRPFCGAAERVGLNSRTTHEGYPERAKVPRDKIAWATELAEYAPPHCGAYAGGEGASAASSSWCGVLPRSDDGRVLNPSGRTGLVGCGTLSRCGPNQEIRVCVTRRGENGVAQVVVVRRKEHGEWQLPGGMLPASADSATRPTHKQFRQAFTLQAAAGRSKHSEASLDQIFGQSPPEGSARQPQPAAGAEQQQPQEAKPKAEDEAKPEAKPKAEDEAKPKEDEAKPKAEGEAKPTAEGEAKPKAEGEAKPTAEGEVKSKAEAPPPRRRASSTAATVAARAEQPWLVHCGYADVSSATDDAWTESAVGHFHATEAAASDLLLQEGAGAVAVRWVSVPAAGGEARGYWEDVKPLHRQWIYASLMLGGARRGAE